MLHATLMKTAEQLCQVMSMEAARYSAAPFLPVVLEDAVFVDLIDPVNGLPSYEGAWRNPQGIRCGSLTFNSDGSYYAEYDVLNSSSSSKMISAKPPPIIPRTNLTSKTPVHGPWPSC